MKKSRLPEAAGLFVAVCVGALALRIAFAPLPPVTPPESVHVEVGHPAEPVVAPVPVMPAPQGEEQQTAGSIISVPVMPEREAIVPKGRKPEIAIIIDDVGLNLSGSQRAIKLPGFVTLSFMPYAERLDEQTAEARDAGHELMLHMPMEPIGRQDPGPGALLTTLSPEEVRARLDHALGSFEGFDGVNNHMGSRFTAYAAGMEIVMAELQKRHLFFLDSRTSAQSVGYELAKKDGLPTAGRDVFLDDSVVPEAIRAQLAATERVALRKGYAIAIGHPHENTLAVLEAWLPGAEKRGFVFVPVHDLVKTSSREAQTP